MAVEFQQLTPLYRGLLMVIGGTILLLHSLGVMEKMFGLVIIAVSLLIIAQGFVISGLYEKMQSLMKK